MAFICESTRPKCLQAELTKMAHSLRNLLLHLVFWSTIMMTDILTAASRGWNRRQIPCRSEHYSPALGIHPLNAGYEKTDVVILLSGTTNASTSGKDLRNVSP